MKELKLCGECFGKAALMGLFLAMIFFLSYWVYLWFLSYGWVRAYFSIGLGSVLLNYFFPFIFYRCYPASDQNRKSNSLKGYLIFFFCWLPFLMVPFCCWPGFWMFAIYALPVMHFCDIYNDLTITAISKISRLNFRLFLAALMIGFFLNFSEIRPYLEAYCEIVDIIFGAI